MQDDDMDAMPDLVVDVRHDGETAIVKLQGDLDVATANVRLAHPSGAVVRLLDITGLSAYFVIDSAPRA